MRRLVITNGPLVGQTVEVAADLVLGRGEADLNLPDLEVSRRHAVVRAVPEGLLVEDLGSANGTFVNGARIQTPTRLGSGDVVQLGQSSLRVEIDEDQTVVVGGPAAESPPVEVPPMQPGAIAGSRPKPVVSSPVIATFSPPTPSRGRRAATRRLGATVITVGAIIATAVALVLYFGLR